MRIHHRGLIIPPLDFLDVSKKSNTYRHLSSQMVMKVISHLKSHPSDTIAINITANDITRKEFCTWLLSVIEQSHLGNHITFEITEQEGIENFDVVKEFIAEAKRIGVEIAIDDFGSGYSNFEHLIHLDVNYLKIDGSLIENIDKDENAQLIVKTIVTFAQALHIKTIAEYVSSEEIFKHVQALGIDYSQGYFIGKPEPKTH
jgi:EAL domain-containing protein (putative c-di-GMP-specific phosphodiesterase class I)